MTAQQAQDEDKSKVEFYPSDLSFIPTFTFAVARVRLLSSISTTVNNVRVFFRLFNAGQHQLGIHRGGLGEGRLRFIRSVAKQGTVTHSIPKNGTPLDRC